MLFLNIPLQREQEEKKLQKLRANMTPAELEAEKLKQLKLQEEAELKLVKQAFGKNGLRNIKSVYILPKIDLT